MWAGGHLRLLLGLFIVVVLAAVVLFSFAGGASAVPCTADALEVTAAPSSQAGASLTITVTATAAGVQCGDYDGTVHFTSTADADPFPATLPTDYQFTPGVGGDNGAHTFSAAAKLYTVGTRSITATDTVTSSITGQGGIAVSPAPASHLVVDGFPSPTVAGVAHDVTVTAKDPWENTDTNYAGIVHFSSTDGLPFAATLPGNYTFTTGSGADNGVHTFTNGVTLFNARRSRLPRRTL